MTYVLISDGCLYVRNDDGRISEIESAFIRSKMDRSDRDKIYNAWKRKGSEPESSWNSLALWGGQAISHPLTGFRFCSIAVGEGNDIYYTLRNNKITGLFQYDLKTDEEIRLFHKNDYLDNGFDFSPTKRQFAISSFTTDGSADIQLLDNKGSLVCSITGGDSQDLYPSFRKSAPDRILFQSAGIARNEHGIFFAVGPSAILDVHIPSGEISTILSDDRFDYLLPREDGRGNLYCIRRPYRGIRDRSIMQKILYVITFPFHFLVAVVNFLNAFTFLFNRSARRSGGPSMDPPSQDKYIRVFGETIRLAGSQSLFQPKEGPSLVPKSWELIKVAADHSISVIASRVSSYDLDAKGHIHWTNGYTVVRVSENESDIQFRPSVIEHIKIHT